MIIRLIKIPHWLAAVPYPPKLNSNEFDNISYFYLFGCLLLLSIRYDASRTIKFIARKWISSGFWRRIHIFMAQIQLLNRPRASQMHNVNDEKMMEDDDGIIESNCHSWGGNSSSRIAGNRCDAHFCCCLRCCCGSSSQCVRERENIWGCGRDFIYFHFRL